MVALPSLLLLLFALPASSQKEIVTIPNWHVHEGDNPAWANGDFDDSQWAVIPYREMTRNGYEGGFHWYRATIQVPADFTGQDLAIGIDPLDEVYDVYVNGAPVGHWGSWEPKPQGPFPRHLAFAIPPGLVKGPVAHIAIRRWNGGAGYFWLTFGASGYFRFPHPRKLVQDLPSKRWNACIQRPGRFKDYPGISLMCSSCLQPPSALFFSACSGAMQNISILGSFAC